MATPEEITLINAHAQRIRASGLLGRSSLIQKLFDYLIECANNGRVPKEIEVAIDGFGKGVEFDASQDALVRVYVHKLRRKLDEFYAGPARDDLQRIAIPKGEYRLAVEQREAPVPEVVLPAGPGIVRRALPWAAAACIGVLAAALIFLWGEHTANGGADSELAAVRKSAVWAPLLDDDLPINVVVGDYYVFGERGRFDQVDRLVRDFNINSREDLERVSQEDPQLAAKYTDMSLGYLPTGSAFALRDVLPILAGANKRVRVTLASEMDPTLFKTSHVIYIGYLSGLGMLRDVVFAGSRFQVGMSYDELIDTKTGKPYVSEAAGPLDDGTRYRDYGYFSTFAGPNGNQNLIITGTRDTALMQIAETVTARKKLGELAEHTVGSNAFEALYEVYGMHHTNMEATLLLAAPMNAASIWSDGIRTAATPAVAQK
jgi:hypothetical protein